MDVQTEIAVSSFYAFRDLTTRRAAVEAGLREAAARLGVRGLAILADEGLNSTVCGHAGALAEFEQVLQLLLGGDGIQFKRSLTAKFPFRSYRIKIRKEIVTTGGDGILVEAPVGKRISPAELDALLSNSEEKVALVDTRNSYETAIGKFRGAIDPNIRLFEHFQAAAQDLPLERAGKVVIYCTGGIRCEKAAIMMERAGYKDVYQLDGGILSYLDQFPNRHFEGECFVFDSRVSVDQALNASARYELCPHCGNPAEEPIECARCGSPRKVCTGCQETGHRTCSKDCEYQYTRRRVKAAS